MPALDGLRGVAVLAVMAFHAGVAWAGGGLLGVDVFFVLSGYLVTSILLRDHLRSGAIRLARFWARRARRLLPALVILLFGMCVYARLDGSGISPSQLRGDALATLLYASNWHYIATGQNYFLRYGAPSPLLHTWSLGVEEQFYLVWPIVTFFVLRRFGRRGLGWVAGTLAGASAVGCAVLYATGASVDRLYYGTDTRAQSLMLGALLAVLVPMDRVAPRPSGGAGRRSIAVAGLVGAGVLAYCLHEVTGDGPFLYLGGFAVVAGATAAVVAAVVVRPQDVLARALSWRPLRYTGRISYGLYLYHWPLFLLLTESRTGLGGPALLGLRFGVTFLVAAVSYRFVEQPIRVGLSRRPTVAGLSATEAHAGRPARVRPRLAAPVTVAGGLVVLVTALLVATETPTLSAAAALAQSARPANTFVPPAGVSSAHPETALLLGDSMALTLGVGLAKGADAWGINVVNQGAIGCDLDPESTVNVMGTVSKAAQGCPDWRTSWTQLVDRTDPDVVVVFLGRWETIDRLYAGRWTTVGQSAFDTHLQTELGQVIQIASSRGAQVVFLTLPYIAQTTTQPDGAPWDMNLPSRTDAYNSDVRAAVARYPGQASIIDLNKLLDPAGHYVSYIDGVRVRDYDDEHLSLAGGELLRGDLLPSLVQAGAAHFEQASAGS